MVRSHLDYCSSVRAPYKKGDIDALEKVQKILPALKRLPYSKRLKACQIPTLHYRRIRGNMIETSGETYKIITGKYQGCVATSLIKEETYVTRGNDFRLQKLRVRYDLRKFGFFQSSS